MYELKIKKQKVHQYQEDDKYRGKSLFPYGYDLVFPVLQTHLGCDRSEYKQRKPVLGNIVFRRFKAGNEMCREAYQKQDKEQDRLLLYRIRISVKKRIQKVQHHGKRYIPEHRISRHKVVNKRKMHHEILDVERVIEDSVKSEEQYESRPISRKYPYRSFYIEASQTGLFIKRMEQAEPRQEDEDIHADISGLEYKEQHVCNKVCPGSRICQKKIKMENAHAQDCKAEQRIAVIRKILICKCHFVSFFHPLIREINKSNPERNRRSPAPDQNTLKINRFKQFFSSCLSR